MILHELELADYRCYQRRRFAFQPKINVLTGPNGAGKTSALEAIGYLSTVRSFRRAHDAELIRFGCDSAHIEARLDSAGRERKLTIELGGRKRVITADGEVFSSPRQLLGILPSVLFSPEDIGLVRDGPGERRRFLDISLSQLLPRYVRELARYRKLLADKSVLLREIAEKPSFRSILPEYNKRLSETGAFLSVHRESMTRRLNEAAARHHEKISGGRESLELTLRSHALDAEEAYDESIRKLEAELQQKQCLTGAHKDEIDIRLNGRILRDFGSQGQVRTAALAIKLAQRELFAADIGEPPLLLLDDVLSELDPGRRDYVLNNIGDGQVFISSCDEIAGISHQTKIEIS